MHFHVAIHLLQIRSCSSRVLTSLLLQAMAQVLEQLPAIRKLLESVAKSKCFEQVCAGQRLTIETILVAEKCITAELASQLLQELQQMLWPPHDLDVLTDAVARKVSASASAMQSPSSKLQNFEALHLYFSNAQWDCLRSGMAPDLKMDLIVSHAVALGLRFPTEPSTQKLVGLYYMVSNGYSETLSIAGNMKLEFVKFAKRRVKELGRSPLSLVPMLPADTRDFQRAHPTVYQTVFKDGPPAACPLDIGKLRVVQRAIPMRCTHKDTGIEYIHHHQTRHSQCRAPGNNQSLEVTPADVDGGVYIWDTTGYRKYVHQHYDRHVQPQDSCCSREHPMGVPFLVVVYIFSSRKGHATSTAN
jgi:hypothetical protein